MRVTYDRGADWASVSLRATPPVDRTEALDADRRVDYADNKPIGAEFLYVQAGVRTGAFPRRS